MRTNSPEITYLAAPYTHTDPNVRVERFEKVTKVAAQLIANGRIVFSPLTMTHPIDQILADNGETLGSDYWVSFDEAFMCHCSEIYVLTLEGWRESSGVKRELAFFERQGKPITFLDPREFA
jgi:hypothetical protein